MEKCLSGQNLFTDEFIASHLNRLIKLSSDKRRCAALITNKSKIITESTSAIDEHFLHHSSFRAINQTAVDQLKLIEENKKNNILIKDSKSFVLPYLCTTYDVFLTNEPCVMCAMALLHSRIKRLFYLDLEQFHLNLTDVDCMNDFAIIKLQIHTKKGLNHHFEVFRVGVQK